MDSSNFRKICVRAWLWVGILTSIIWILPVAYRATRELFLFGVVLSWVGAYCLWWRKKIVSLPILAVTFLLVALVLLPNRPVQKENLADDYCRSLRFFRGVHYIWGGEGLLGIDCSGLVRQGLVWGQLNNGLRTLNGRPIRDAIWLWWNDCSALALRDGFGGVTRECFKARNILEAESGPLKMGDLAVTADGVHVLAFLGNRTWIEADPNIRKVIEVIPPTDNPWFQCPVIIMRWQFLDQN